MGMSNLMPRVGASEARSDRDAERLLVEQAKRDPLAFGRLFDTYYDRILSYVLHRTADVYIAQELTSNVFYNAMRNLGKYRWRGIPFSAWLYRIASNEVSAHFRRGARSRAADMDGHPDLQLEDANAGADAEIIEAQRAVAVKTIFLELHSAISELDPKYQEVIVLHYFEGKTLEDIGQIMAKPIGSVKTLLHRGRNQLRTRLKASYLKLVE
jgi:RNA polymerase sigma-70 factor (ECF subfamily)